MANTLKQSFIQVGIPQIPKRLILQYDSETEEKQFLINYEDLTDEQKAVFDAFEELSKTLMV
tara:strand:- start:230 stop:415 length:186 start_codon:yes stop_codon:yes gene_type:complete